MIRLFAPLVLALAVLLSACGSPADPGPEASPTPSAAARGVTLDDLKTAGLRIVADEQAPVDTRKGLVFTQAQADYLVAEQSRGAGIVGRELDRLAPMPAGSPTLSYLIAAWIVAAPTPSAKTAGVLMGEHDWRYAQSIVFPTAVVTMFVSDVGSALERETRPSRSWERPPLQAIQLRADPCVIATTFLANAIDAVFNTLKLDPKTGGDLPLIGWLVAVWDTAVEIMRGIVHAVVDTLTQPAFTVLRTAMGILAVVSIIKSYLGTPQLSVDLDPPDLSPGNPYHFAVGDAPDIAGTYIAKADPKQAWPETLKSCARAVNIDVPEVVANGAKVTWTVTDPLPVTHLTSPAVGKVENNEARLAFVTGREDPETAKGKERLAPATATATIERKELDELLKLVRGRLQGAIDELLNKIPVAPLRSAVRGVVVSIVNPVLNELEAEIKKQTSGVFTVSGSGTVWVAFHQPDEPTPTPEPPKPSKKPKPKGDFCGKYREVVQWWVQAGGLSSSGEMASRLKAIRPLGSPAQQRDLDVLIRIFELVASGANGGVIGNEVAERDFPGAGTRLGTACGVNPKLLQQG